MAVYNQTEKRDDNLVYLVNHGQVFVVKGFMSPIFDVVLSRCLLTVENLGFDNENVLGYELSIGDSVIIQPAKGPLNMEIEIKEPTSVGLKVILSNKGYQKVTAVGFVTYEEF